MRGRVRVGWTSGVDATSDPALGPLLVKTRGAGAMHAVMVMVVVGGRE